MASFFVSHSSRDNDAARRIRAWLEAQGYTSVFLDFDPAVGIPAGREWEDELYSQLRKADVVLFLATAAATESKWCHAELVLSRSLGRTIVPVLLEPGARHPLVRDTQAVRVELDGEGSLRPLEVALERLNIDPLDTLGWDAQLSPYPGLAAYQEDRAGVFFGRDSEIQSVLEPLRRPYGEAAERFVLIAGASGSGKSSLLRAGVLPRLRRLERGWLVLPTFTPEDAPLEQLARSVAHALGAATDWRTCHERLRAGADGLKALTRDLTASDTETGVVIPIDQAEQLVTQSSPGDRVAFLELLATALSGRTQLRAVATLRSEYLSELVAGSPFEGRLAATVPVGRLSRGGLCEVIERPAQRAGLELEPGLVARMVEDTLADTGEGDPLPLLAFTLQQLYEQRASTTRITVADYEAVGGVIGALKDEADRTFERLQRQGFGEAVLPTLLELAHVERERRPTGRTVKRSRLAAAPEIVDAFVEARLLTSAGEGTIQVAHEALFSEWPLLRDEIARSQQHLIARSQLERDAPEWERSGRDPSYLLSGARLETARAVVAAAPDADPVVSDFVVASARRSRRQRWRSRSFAALLGLIVVAGAAFGARAVLDRVHEAARKSDATADTVMLGGGVEVEEHEVTNRQYASCVDQGVCEGLPTLTDREPENPPPGEAFPVILVTAPQAVKFCRWLGRRLPSKPEYEALWRKRPDAQLWTKGGFLEWTSTQVGSARLQVGRERSKWYEMVEDPTIAEENVGFRCAREGNG